MIAGKTGTTNDGSDVWFVGYTPNLVAAFWFGYDERHMIAYEASGGDSQRRHGRSFYMQGWTEPSSAIRGSRHRGWLGPRSIHRGWLANECCSRAQNGVFQAGHEPTTLCRARRAGAGVSSTWGDQTSWPQDVGKKATILEEDRKGLSKIFKF
jgi:penicillin-binding protein 1A